MPIASCIFTGLLTSKYWALGGLALGQGGLALGHGGLALEGLVLDGLVLEVLAQGHGGLALEGLVHASNGTWRVPSTSNALPCLVLSAKPPQHLAILRQEFI